MSEHIAAPRAQGTPVGPIEGAIAGTLPLFAVTLFLSALLLFWVQPLVARMILPLLGGASAVWTTAMVFFQITLLAGYAFAHVSIRVLGPRRQAYVHVTLVILALAALPLALNPSLEPPNHAFPIVWLLILLAGLVGLPFFAISATAPALQAWFAATGHPEGRDPYFLYGASNLGSLLALLGFPLVLEPFFSNDEQNELWTGGFVVLTFLLLLCLTALVSRAGVSISSLRQERDQSFKRSAKITWAQRLRWLVLAFVPSSLLLGVTNHLSTDVAAVPLLWVIPLALYLLTFVLVFARRQLIPHAAMVLIQPYVAGLLVVGLWLSLPIAIALPYFLFAFFALAMMCHGELAARRPAAENLTEFYLWMSIGGAFGGLFNAVIAPLAFNGIYEFPLAIVAACLLVPRNRAVHGIGNRWIVLSLLTLMVALVLLIKLGVLPITRFPTAEAGGVFLTIISILILLRHQPLAFPTSVAIAIVVPIILQSGAGITAAKRGFYGVIRVAPDRTGEYTMMMHGTTLHGVQAVAPDRRQDLLLYYSYEGPLGQVISQLAAEGRMTRVAAVGLGTGNVACYRRPGQTWTFYEIDPTVVQFAQDPRYFDYLSRCAPDAEIVLGDARLKLSSAEPASLDLIILDAFSSDAVPVHLMTREALALYLDKLTPRGVLMFHVSNRVLDLTPVIANLAADVGASAWSQFQVGDKKDHLKRHASEWVALARGVDDVRFIDGDSRWRRLAAQPGARSWTDSFSNIVSAIRR